MPNWPAKHVITSTNSMKRLRFQVVTIAKFWFHSTFTTTKIQVCGFLKMTWL